MIRFDTRWDLFLCDKIASKEYESVARPRNMSLGLLSGV
jgi:hypothetical protein